MKTLLPVALAASFVLTACSSGVDNNTAAGALFGGATGAIAATAFGGNSQDRWLAGLAGAGIGAALADSQNRTSGGGNSSSNSSGICVFPDGRQAEC